MSGVSWNRFGQSVTQLALRMDTSTDEKIALITRNLQVRAPCSIIYLCTYDTDGLSMPLPRRKYARRTSSAT